eukprot:gene17265-20587_t
MKGDISCCLPTGLGKTLVAALVIARMRQLNPQKKVVFLVDRIPLIDQQSEYIQLETGLVVAKLHGDMPKNLDSDYDVLVIIAAVFINLVKDGTLNILEFSLLVFDEAHHIVKSHPFAQILNDLHANVQLDVKPKVLGLTASPAGRNDFFSTLLSLKVISRISGTRLISSNSIEDYVSNPRHEIIELALNSHEQYLFDLIERINLQTRQKYSDVYDNDQDDTIYSLSDVPGNVQEIITTFARAYDILSTSQAIPYDKEKEEKDTKCKLEVALDIINKYRNKPFRAIIFVQTRDMTKHVIDEITRLHDLYPFIKADFVTGHGQSGDKSVGMTTPKQKKVLDRFRTGSINLLIATNVVEEGLDVPSCNLVIRLDSPSTVTALIQCRGRLREKNSEFYGIVKSKKNSFAKIMHQERHMKDALQFLQYQTCTDSLLKEMEKMISKQMFKEWIQRSGAAGFNIQPTWKSVTQGHRNVDVVLSLNGVKVGQVNSTSKKTGEDQICRQVMTDMIIPKILVNYSNSQEVYL